LNTMFLAITTAPSFTHRRSGGWFPTTLSSSSLICLIDFAVSQHYGQLVNHSSALRERTSGGKRYRA
jgi:hypothetical protein